MTKSTVSSDSATADLLKLPHFPERRRHHDPFADLVHRDSITNDAPMIKLDFHVTIRGGLAFVKAKRTYINKTNGPIEAVMSLPVSIHAAFFGLSAVIDGKHYDAQAKPKQEALETYEEAIDEGKAAVLHEELLRGIHSISVGNLGVGKTVMITVRWAELLRFHDGVGQLRIPLSVGDVYGISPLEDVDTLTVGGPIPEATLHMQHDAESVELAGGNLRREEGEVYSTKIPGNAPIELKVTGVAPSELTGISRGGRPVTLQISPRKKQRVPLNAAVLVDRSDSMGAQCTYFDGNSETRHEAVVRGLRELQPLLIDQDRLALWEFDTDCDRVGEFTSNHPREFGRLLTKLSGPRGDTAIGRALEKVGASEEGKDILLITDGQSYDLDVQRLAKSGHRIFAVLVGEGSLEAMVGHLAVLSGGDLHFSFGADVDQAIQACIEGMRQKPNQGAHCDLDEIGLPERVVTVQGNATIEASWSQAVENPHVNSEFSEAVAAYAASLAFAGAEEEWAASIAVQAGLVTHLTSLVLVAKDAQIQEELPRTIKQSLPTVRETVLCFIAPSIRHASAPDPRKYYSSIDHSRTESLGEMDQSLSSSPLSPSILGGDIDDNPQAQNTTLHPIFKSSPSIDWDTIVSLGKQIDWNTEGSKLARGELRGIPEDIAKEITNLAGKVADFTNQITASRQKWALIFVIALAAYAVQGDSKWAARVYRKIIKENKMVPELSGLILMYVRWITGEWKNPESITDRDSGK